MFRGIFMDLNHNLELFERLKDDIKFISSSTVRTKIIISLTQGKLKDLKDELEVDSSTILHAMKKLEDKNLIYKKGDEYLSHKPG